MLGLFQHLHILDYSCCASVNSGSLLQTRGDIFESSDKLLVCPVLLLLCDWENCMEDIFQASPAKLNRVCDEDGLVSNSSQGNVSRWDGFIANMIKNAAILQCMNSISVEQAIQLQRAGGTTTLTFLLQHWPSSPRFSRYISFMTDKDAVIKTNLLKILSLASKKTDARGSASESCAFLYDRDIQ